jgi:phosphatidylinositol alpha-1,6-mannosyltransferase
LTIARLEERYKGHDVMIRALPIVTSRVPEAEWVVVGDGPLRPHLEDLAAATGVTGSVRWLGRVDDAERDRWLARARVFAMPSRVGPANSGGEGFGIACMEASGHAVPVVAGDSGGTTDSVVHGQTGLLVDPTDHIAVADAISALLRDPARAQEMGRAGADRAADFAWPLVAARVRELLEEITAGHGGRRG